MRPTFINSIAKFVCFALFLGQFAITPAQPAAAEVLPITPDVVANGPDAFRIEVQRVELERWGLPNSQCTSFDDRTPVRKITVSARITNLSAQAIAELGFAFFSNADAAITNCIYYYDGIAQQIGPGQAREITFVGFVYEHQAITKLVITSPTSARAICFNGRAVVACAGAPATNNANGQIVRVSQPAAPSQGHYYVGTAKPNATVPVTEARAGYVDVIIDAATYSSSGWPDTCRKFDPSKPVKKLSVSMRIANLSEQAAERWGIVTILEKGFRPIRMCNEGAEFTDDIPSGNGFRADFSAYIDTDDWVKALIVTTDVGFQIVCLDKAAKVTACLNNGYIGPADGPTPSKLLSELRVGYAKTDLLKTQYVRNVRPRTRDCTSYEVDKSINTKVLLTVRVTNQSNQPLTGLSAEMTTDGKQRYFACPQVSRSGDIPPIPPKGVRMMVLEGFIGQGEQIKTIVINTDIGIEGLCLEKGVKTNCFKK
ncbi:MAG: hypothetical protein KIH69_009540 [Anaerolineae bacterium]|nr:hypothetical protein [Anaerolineae bacterium]